MPLKKFQIERHRMRASNRSPYPAERPSRLALKTQRAYVSRFRLIREVSYSALTHVFLAQIGVDDLLVVADLLGIARRQHLTVFQYVDPLRD